MVRSKERWWAFILGSTVLDQDGHLKGIAHKAWTSINRNPDLKGPNLDLKGLKTPFLK